MGRSDRFRQIVLVTLAALVVGAGALTIRSRARTNDDDSADGRIEAIGDLSGLQRSSGPNDPDASPVGLDRSSGNGATAEGGQRSDRVAGSVLAVAGAKTQGSEAPTTARPTATRPSTTTEAPTTTAPTTTEAPTTTTTTTTTTVPPPPPAALVNGGFVGIEVPAGSYILVDDGQVAGWTSDSGVFEIWHPDMEGVGSPDGTNLIELNANRATTIHQDISVTPGSKLEWSFHHRGRDGKDTVELLIGPSDGPLERVKKARTGRKWKRYRGSYEVPEGQSSIRIAFRARDSGSVGNLLDDIRLAPKS